MNCKKTSQLISKVRAITSTINEPIVLTRAVNADSALCYYLFTKYGDVKWPGASAGHLFVLGANDLSEMDEERLLEENLIPLNIGAGKFRGGNSHSAAYHLAEHLGLLNNGDEALQEIIWQVDMNDIKATNHSSNYWDLIFSFPSLLLGAGLAFGCTGLLLAKGKGYFSEKYQTCQKDIFEATKIFWHWHTLSRQMSVQSNEYEKNSFNAWQTRAFDSIPDARGDDVVKKIYNFIKSGKKTALIQGAFVQPATQITKHLDTFWDWVYAILADEHIARQDVGKAQFSVVAVPKFHDIPARQCLVCGVTSDSVNVSRIARLAIKEEMKKRGLVNAPHVLLINRPSTRGFEVFTDAHIQNPLDLRIALAAFRIEQMVLEGMTGYSDSVPLTQSGTVGTQAIYGDYRNNRLCMFMNRPLSNLAQPECLISFERRFELLLKALAMETLQRCSKCYPTCKYYNFGFGPCRHQRNLTRNYSARYCR